MYRVSYFCISLLICSSQLYGSANEVIRYGVAQHINRKPTQEDTFCIELTDDAEGHNFFGVFDGHGGTDIATILAQGKGPSDGHAEIPSLHKILINSIKRLGFNKYAIEAGFEQMDKTLLEQEFSCGSTAVIAITHKDDALIAHCGDSRALAINATGKIVHTTQDHKPNEPEEANRIENAGGRVTYWGVPRVDNTLAVARAFGDKSLKFSDNSNHTWKEQRVTACPTVAKLSLKDIRYLFLGCDGIFDVVANDIVTQQIMNFKNGSSHSTPETYNRKPFTINSNSECEEKIAHRLCHLAMQHRSNADNVTALVVTLNHHLNQQAHNIPYKISQSPSIGNSKKKNFKMAVTECIRFPNIQECNRALELYKKLANEELTPEELTNCSEDQATVDDITAKINRLDFTQQCLSNNPGNQQLFADFNQAIDQFKDGQHSTLFERYCKRLRNEATDAFNDANNGPAAFEALVEQYRSNPDEQTYNKACQLYYQALSDEQRKIYEEKSLSISRMYTTITIFNDAQQRYEDNPTDETFRNFEAAYGSINQLKLSKEVDTVFRNLVIQNDHDDRFLKIICREQIDQKDYHQAKKFLIASGANLNNILQLNAGTLNGNHIEALIACGADVNYQDPASGSTPLHYAVCTNNHAAVEMLIKKGADVTIKNSLGKTALDITKQFDNDCTDITRLLAKHEILNIVTTPANSEEKKEDNITRLFELISNSGYTVHEKIEEGKSILDLAKQHGNNYIYDLLQGGY